MTEPIPTLSAVSSEQWAALAEKRIFFGHQSVGGNVIDGVQELLAEHPEIPLKVVETEDPLSMEEPGLYHARIGENGAPMSKLEAFREIVSGASVAESGIAMVKYCYVDIEPETDPVALFETYREEVDALRERNPGLTIVHVTLPLREDPGVLAYWKARLRGNPSEREVNLIRQRYNELMRTTYGGREPVFDLAGLEAAGPSGELSTVTFQGEEVPALAPDWTYDGGHLNEAGRRRIAEAFLVTLARIQSVPTRSTGD